MKLTNKGRYAVMAMADLALNAKNGPISLTEISLRQNISLAYLEQIFLKLKNNKLVKSSRGANGGYVLEKPASEIKLSNIFLQSCPTTYSASFANIDPSFTSNQKLSSTLFDLVNADSKKCAIELECFNISSIFGIMCPYIWVTPSNLEGYSKL